MTFACGAKMLAHAMADVRLVSMLEWQRIQCPCIMCSVEAAGGSRQGAHQLEAYQCRHWHRIHCA